MKRPTYQSPTSETLAGWVRMAAILRRFGLSKHRFIIHRSNGQWKIRTKQDPEARQYQLLYWGPDAEKNAPEHLRLPFLPNEFVDNAGRRWVRNEILEQQYGLGGNRIRRWQERGCPPLAMRKLSFKLITGAVACSRRKKTSRFALAEEVASVIAARSVQSPPPPGHIRFAEAAAAIGVQSFGAFARRISFARRLTGRAIMPLKPTIPDPVRASKYPHFYAREHLLELNKAMSKLGPMPDRCTSTEAAIAFPDVVKNRTTIKAWSLRCFWLNRPLTQLGERLRLDADGDLRECAEYSKADLEEISREYAKAKSRWKTHAAEREARKILGVRQRSELRGRLREARKNGCLIEPAIMLTAKRWRYGYERAALEACKAGKPWPPASTAAPAKRGRPRSPAIATAEAFEEARATTKISLARYALANGMSIKSLQRALNTLAQRRKRNQL